MGLVVYRRQLHVVAGLVLFSWNLLAATSVANWALFKVNLDGTDLQQVTKPVDVFCGSPDWSPNGEWIAFDTWPTANDYSESKVCIVRPNGEGLKVIGRGAMPSWSPDGTQLVCHTYDRPPTIVVMNADGSGRETVINHWGSPRWSPKFDRIASLDSRLPAIHLFDLRTGTERVLFSDGPYANLGFSISPTGLDFCFGCREGGVAITSLGEESEELEVKWLFEFGQTNTTSWSPDGTQVIFEWSPTRDSTAQLYVKDLTSSKPPIRLEWQDPKRPYASPDWSPDGKSIVFCSLIKLDKP